MADPTLGDLHKAKAVTPEQVAAAVDAYMADPVTGEFPIGGYTLDLAAAVLASKFATDALANSEVKEVSKRSAVKTAFLLAVPTAS